MKNYNGQICGVINNHYHSLHCVDNYTDKERKKGAIKMKDYEIRKASEKIDPLYNDSWNGYMYQNIKKNERFVNFKSGWKESRDKEISELKDRIITLGDIIKKLRSEK